jgi:hypothetical protein
MDSKNKMSIIYNDCFGYNYFKILINEFDEYFNLKFKYKIRIIDELKYNEIGDQMLDKVFEHSSDIEKNDSHLNEIYLLNKKLIDLTEYRIIKLKCNKQDHKDIQKKLDRIFKNKFLIKP